MPRPTHNPGGAPAAKQKSKFSVSGLIQARKERKRMQEENNARLITNNTAINELNIIDVLSSINYVRSKIPAEQLEYKSDPKQQWGDLEYGARAAQKMMSSSPNFNYDISMIDVKLLALAERLKNAVANGEVRAAYAAKGALITCISKIRNRIPTVSEELAEGFIESGAKYIDTWLLLVDQSHEADAISQNIENQKKAYDVKKVKFDADKEDLFDKIQNNPLYTMAYKDIKDQTAPTDKNKWTPEMKEVRSMLSSQRFEQSAINASLTAIVTSEGKLKTVEYQIDTLSVKVNELPIPADPNALNKYNEQMTELINDFARVDTEIDEMLGTMEKIDGALTALEEAPGAVHLRDMMSAQAEKFIEELQEQQRREVEAQGANKQSLLRSLGLNTAEEQEALKEQYRLAQEEAMKEAFEETQQEEIEETEAQYLYEE